MTLSSIANLTPFQRSAISAAAGFFFYGAWAYFVNSMHGVEAAIKAACVQGSYSFVLTLIMTLLIEGIYRHLFKLFSHSLLVIWGTVLLCCAIIFSTSWWVNATAGTPEIFDTVILGYVIGGIYTTIYVHALAHGRTINSI